MSGLILRRAGWMLLGILSASLPAIAPAAAVIEPSPIEKGQYISRLADCGGCHTRTGGTALDAVRVARIVLPSWSLPTRPDAFGRV
jgi:hypothetical protein